MSRTDKHDDAYHHGDLRKALLDSARMLLEEGGPPALSLREISRRVGVSAPAAYHHFRNLEAIAQAVAEQGFGELAAALANARSGEGMRAMGMAYIGFAQANPGLYRLMFSDGLAAKSDAGAALKAMRTRAFETLRAALEAQVPPDQARALALYLWSVTHGLALLAIDGQLGAATQAQGQIAQVLEVTGRALPPLATS
jgi:AcrR family transcriptional regulator